MNLQHLYASGGNQTVTCNGTVYYSDGTNAPGNASEQATAVAALSDGQAAGDYWNLKSASFIGDLDPPVSQQFWFDNNWGSIPGAGNSTSVEGDFSWF